MTDEPIRGQPLSPTDQALLDAYYQEPIRAAERFDELAKNLLSIELAVPGIYAAGLQVLLDDRDGLSILLIVFMTLAFGLWLAALILTVCALFPRPYKVLDGALRYTDPNTDPNQRSGASTISEFFEKSARFKRRLLLCSIFLFFAGTVAAVVAVFL